MDMVLCACDIGCRGVAMAFLVKHGRQVRTVPFRCDTSAYSLLIWTSFLQSLDIRRQHQIQIGTLALGRAHIDCLHAADCSHPSTPTIDFWICPNANLEALLKLGATPTAANSKRCSDICSCNSSWTLNPKLWQFSSCLFPLSKFFEVQDGLAHTPLHWAARQGFEGISQALVNAQARDAHCGLLRWSKNGGQHSQASIHAENRDRITPLHLAAQSNSGSIVRNSISKSQIHPILTVVWQKQCRDLAVIPAFACPPLKAPSLHTRQIMGQAIPNFNCSSAQYDSQNGGSRSSTVLALWAWFYL